MKTLLLSIFTFAAVSFQLSAQDAEPAGIQWWGEDEMANEFVWKGLDHLLNIEREQAFTYFQAAVEKDPSLFAPRVFLSRMSTDDTRAYQKIQAKKLVAGKNETSRLYVSLMDTESGQAGAEKRREIWRKMHELAPDGPFIFINYARTLESTEEQIAACERLLGINAKNNRSNDYVHNMLGYIYYQQGDKVKAKMHFDKYLELRPDGYNAYDSMAEFYQREGDLEKALAHYKKALEKYPGAINARNRVERIETEMEEKGDLWLVTTEYMDPSSRTDYLQWGKEYKKIADETQYRTFLVSSKNNAFNYAWNIGKTMGDLDEFIKDRDKWHKDHPEIETQFQKYHHSITSTKRALWRHNPDLSYQPAESAGSDENTYVRSYRAYVKFEHDAAIKDILKEFKEKWEEKKISTGYGVFWNVFGEDGPCVSIRTAYKDIAAWQADMDEVEEKIGEAELNDLMSRWSEHIRKGQTEEVFPRSELSHRNIDAVTAN